MNDIINLNKDTSGSIDTGEFHQITNEAVTTINSEAAAKSVKRLHQNKLSPLAMNSESDKNRNLKARHPRGIVGTGTATFNTGHEARSPSVLPNCAQWSTPL
ncbi:hypothetical protein WA026_023567, partial [Henosepilachna vigintioctopunctata]